MRNLRFVLSSLGVCAALAGLGVPAHAASEQESLETLRNTVTNLLQALVDQGLLTRDKAQQLVKQAQDQAAAASAGQAVEPGAVRVPYVPEIVRDEISRQVAEKVEPKAVEDVVSRAKSEGWGVPGALPDWLGRVRVYGDVTVRGQMNMYANDNVPGVILDYQAINIAGGIGKLGQYNAFLNVTEDHDYMRLRARFGIEARVTPDVTAGVRLSSGSLTDPSSPSQNLGTTSARYTVGIDQAYIRWDPGTSTGFKYLTAVGGRIANPWFTPTELIYARDLTLEGAAFTGRLGFGGGDKDQSHAFLTLAGLPVQDVPLQSPQSKWLIGGQLGTLFRLDDEGQRLRLAAAYYNFRHVSGVKNAPDSTLLNYTAPQFVRHGNTMFDISNSTTDPTVNLFALAARFQLVELALRYELPIGGRYQMTLNGDAVKNIGDTESDLLARTGVALQVRNRGYVGEFVFGDPAVANFGQWRAALGYRYVQADAVIDAWTDADFNVGGTNTKGFYFWTEVGLARDVWARLRYLSGNEIDGTRYGLDVLQLDLSTRF
jgi:Putative porin